MNFTKLFENEDIALLQDKDGKYYILQAVEAFRTLLPSKTSTTADTLAALQVPQHLLGFNYIVDAVDFVIKTPNIHGRIVKGLYVEVANKYGTTPSKVERAIRNAINSTPITTIYQTIFGTKEHMHNTQFIVSLANYQKKQTVEV